MTHEMNLQDVYFEKIKNYEKIYEIRLNDEKRKLIKIGDEICFSKGKDKSQILKTKVIDLVYFNTFSEMTEKLPLKDIGFDKHSKIEVIEIYHQFYSSQDEHRYGIVAIKIQPTGDDDEI